MPEYFTFEEEEKYELCDWCEEEVPSRELKTVKVWYRYGEHDKGRFEYEHLCHRCRFIMRVNALIKRWLEERGVE